MRCTLCNFAMKGSPLSSHNFIHTWPFCFAVTWCPSATSIYLSVYSNEPVIKYETYGIMWHIAPESRIQNPIIQLQTITRIFTRTFVIARHKCHRCIHLLLFLFLPLSHAQLPFSLRHTCFRRFSLSFGGFGNFEIRWYWDPHLKHFRGIRSVCLLSEASTARVFSFYFIILLNFIFCRMICTSTKGALFLNSMCSLTISTKIWAAVKI